MIPNCIKLTSRQVFKDIAQAKSDMEKYGDFENRFQSLSSEELMSVPTFLECILLLRLEHNEMAKRSKPDSWIQKMSSCRSLVVKTGRTDKDGQDILDGMVKDILELTDNARLRAYMNVFNVHQDTWDLLTSVLSKATDHEGTDDDMKRRKSKIVNKDKETMTIKSLLDLCALDDFRIVRCLQLILGGGSFGFKSVGTLVLMEKV